MPLAIMVKPRSTVRLLPALATTLTPGVVGASVFCFAPAGVPDAKKTLFDALNRMFALCAFSVVILIHEPDPDVILVGGPLATLVPAGCVSEI